MELELTKEGMFHLRCPYNVDSIRLIKSVPSAKWNKKLKVWEFLATFGIYGEIKKALGIVCPELEGEEEHPKVKLHKFKTEPMDHQLPAVVYMLNELGFEVEK